MHWHAFAYDGAAVPPDSAAKDATQAVSPVALADWFRKPASMRRGAYDDASEAEAWLADQLTETGADDLWLPHLREHLSLRQDAYAGYYARGGFHVRALLTCPRTGADRRAVRCPGPPA